MNKILIKMPENVRYMNQANTYLQQKLPRYGKYILDKSLTGCGGTEFFINSGLPLVLVSPRTGVLLNKKQQHPECHLFRDATNTDIKQLKDDLRLYLDKHCGVFKQSTNPVILITLDSAKYVIDELKFRGEIDNYLFLTDEFQCLISDAAFKGDVDLEFLKTLDAEAKNICYMSATPIDETYLNGLQEFQNVDYYKLQWDPNVIVEPTIKEVMMKKGESAQSILKGIIEDYRRDGYFAQKVINGTVVEAKEVVVFVNEVKTILQVVKANRLTPSETTILISSSNRYVSELQKLGFKIDKQDVDRSNPKNTTFTFCSKASFEGRDFYSKSAFTYIFIDGSKDWQIHDTSIEIPQMLGRQRLDENPFKYNAVIYYRTKPSIQSQAEYINAITAKIQASKSLLDSYNNGDDSLKKSLADLVKGKDPNNRYQTNYLDVIDNADGGYSLEINLLVAAAEHNLAMNKTNFYSNPLFLTTAIHSQLSTSYNTKPTELRDFEKDFNKAQTFQAQMKLYCSFLSYFPQYMQVLLSNPFIPAKIHNYYHQFGPDVLAQMNYDEELIASRLSLTSIQGQCRNRFIRGQEYTASEVKMMLQEIYDNAGFAARAKANQISNFIEIEQVQITTSDGTRQRVYRIK